MTLGHDDSTINIVMANIIITAKWADRRYSELKFETEKISASYIDAWFLPSSLW